MDKTALTELVEAGPKRDQRGRRMSTAEEREALVAAYRRSGLTQRVFAQREGLKYSTFTSWLHGVRGAPRPARTTAAASPPVRFVEASLPTTTMVGGLEVTLPDGTKLRGSHARELAALITALRTPGLSWSQV